MCEVQLHGLEPREHLDAPETLEFIYDAAETSSVGLDVIFIYGAGALVPEGWATGLTKLVPAGSSVFGYNLSYWPSDSINWQDMSIKSGALLEALFEKFNIRKRPLEIVCYGFAGVLFKHTLWRAYQQHRYRASLVKMISGVVFLATPHITSSDTKDMQVLSRILQSNIKSTAKRGFTKADASKVAYSSLQFEELKVSFPILSCYETKESKLKSSKWNSKKIIIVNEHLSKISAAREKLIAIDTKLTEIFTTTDAIIHLHIKECGDLCLEHAKSRAKDADTKSVPTTPQRTRTFRSEFMLAQNPKKILGYSDIYLDFSGQPTTPSPPKTASSSFSAAMSMTPPILSSYPTRSLSSSAKTLFTRSDSGSSVEVLLPDIQLPVHYFKPGRATRQNTNFKGRNDTLVKMDNTLLPKTSSISGEDSDMEDLGHRIVVLCGPGGIGKTQLGVEYMHTRKTHFDFIGFLQAESREKLTNSFIGIAIKLGLRSRNSTQDPTITVGNVKSWLEDTPGLRWLLMFDNLEQQDIVQEFWPDDGNGSVLVTSRDPVVLINYGHRSTKIDVGMLPVQDATNLLLEMTQDIMPCSEREIVKDDAEAVVKALDCFPLAIVQMSGVMREYNLNLSQFLKFYKAETHRVGFLDSGGLNPHGYNLNLATTWALAKLSKGAKGILSVISLLDSDGISDAIFLRDSQPSGLLEMPSPETRYLAMRELSRSSLIRLTRTPENNDCEIAIHRVAQDTVRALLLNGPDSHKEAFSKTFAATADLLKAVWPSILGGPQFGYTPSYKVDRWTECGLYLPHVLKMLSIFTQNISEEDRSRCATLTFAWLLCEAAWFENERSNIKESIALAHATIWIYGFLDKNTLSELNSIDIRATAYGTLGAVAQLADKPEDALCYDELNLKLRQQSFAITKNVDATLAAGYGHFAEALALNGVWGKAKDNFNKSIEVRRQMPNFTPLQLFTPLLGLGQIATYEGDHIQAGNYLHEALKDRVSKFGLNDSEGGRTGQLLYAIGTNLQSQGEGYLEESFGYHLKSLLHFRRTVGDGHIWTATAAYKVAVHYIHMKEYAEAIKEFDKACATFSHGFHYQRHYARALFQKSRAMEMLGDSYSAGLILNSAYEIRKALVPDDSRTLSKLEDTDFDELVVFWFR